MDRDAAWGDGTVARLPEPYRPDAGLAAADLLEHWSELSRQDGVPARRALDPRRFGAALPHAFLLERVAPGIARFRICGSHLRLLMGIETKGMPLTAFSAPGERGRFLSLTDTVFDRPAMVNLTLEARRAGHGPVPAEMLILPLRDRTGAVTRAVGTLAAQSVPGFAPCRFAIRAERITPVVMERGGDAWRPGPVPWLRVVK